MCRFAWVGHNAATPNKSITVQLRYEDQHRGSERFPCYYESYTLTGDEVATMIESDLRIRRESSDDPDSVEPRPVDLIFQDLGESEYNQARRFYRNTSAIGVDTTDTPATPALATIRPMRCRKTTTSCVGRTIYKIPTDLYLGRDCGAS